MCAASILGQVGAQVCELIDLFNFFLTDCQASFTLLVGFQCTRKKDH